MIKCWYCNEEITSGNNPEHLGICDKCYNEMFKCGNEFIRNMVTKISDLEAKLAESEKNVEFYQERYSNATTSAYGADLIAKNIQSRLEEEIRELKQQLAEKDLRIEELESQFAYECECNKQFVDCQNENAQLKQQLAEKEKQYQDAVANCVNLANTRAILKLHKVQDRIDDMKSKYNYDIEYLEANNELSRLRKYIDNLINELKEK